MITFYRGAAFAGTTRTTESGVVTYLDTTPADIVFMKYTQDYSDIADKKFFVTRTRRRYKTLEAAAAAVVKASTTQEAP